MKITETRIKAAGVMRCCIATVAEEYKDKEAELGAKSQCRHCKEPFTLVMEGKPTWVPDWQLDRDKGEADLKRIRESGHGIKTDPPAFPL